MGAMHIVLPCMELHGADPYPVPSVCMEGSMHQKSVLAKNVHRYVLRDLTEGFAVSMRSKVPPTSAEYSSTALMPLAC
jgi:hypothetical protein